MRRLAATAEALKPSSERRVSERRQSSSLACARPRRVLKSAATLLRGRQLAVALGLFCLPIAAAGCAIDSHIAVTFSRRAPARVEEVSRVEQSSAGARGTTTRNGQLVGIDCSTFVDYEIHEVTGETFLLQQYLVHLRMYALPAGTAYALSCAGPLVLEIPAAASRLRATAISNNGRQTTLLLKARVPSLPLAHGRQLHAEPGMQLVLVGWPSGLPDGDYRTELLFTLPRARAFREKALLTASVTCGRSSYLQPILPVVTTMNQVPAFTLQPAAQTVQLLLPRIAGAIGTQTEARATLSCGR
jgi:hypothetical protein